LDQPTQAVAPQSGDRPPQTPVQTPPQSGDRPPQTPPRTAEEQPTTQFPRPPDDEDLGSVDPPADRR
jgi:hypothetical protein